MSGIAPSFTPLAPHLGLRVEGVNADHSLDQATIDLLRRKLHNHGLLLFKNQTLDEAAQVRFAKYFGRISKLTPFAKSMPDALYVSNAREDGILGNKELELHCDKFYTQTPPKASTLYGLEVTSNGGETTFSNTAYVVRTMEPGLRDRLTHLKVRHEFRSPAYYGTLSARVSKNPMKETELGALEFCEHPAIAAHPWSDQHYITINGATAVGIVGLPEQESRQVMAQVNALIAQPENLYRHKWEKGDLILWDNFILQHARAPFDSTERRTLRRCQIAHDLEPQ